jgi:nicotinamide-nucleotide amidase
LTDAKHWYIISPMRAEIISIGTELLLGHIVNTNAAFLSQKLAEIGIDVYYQTTVGDNPARLEEAVKKAALRSDIVITSGGLGPTVDDITFETIANLTKRRLILNKTVLKDVKDYFLSKNIKFPKESIRQAYIPEGVKCIRNNVGTAPGIITEYVGKTIVCLPGPPREIEPMFVNNIIPYLKKSSGPKWSIMSRSVKTTGLAESQVNGLVKYLLRLKPPTTVGIYAKLGQVELKIMTKAKSRLEAKRNIDRIEKKIRSKLKDFVFGYDDETLESAVGGLLRKKKLNIAVAESCTGGLLSHRITNISGSSDYFLMGMVTYSNASKEDILGVPEELIKRNGAVSEPVALAMAKGIRSRTGADIGIGITGIAGPAGGTKSKPVGLVYIALAADNRLIVKERIFKGSREEVKFQATQVALDMIRRSI